MTLSLFLFITIFSGVPSLSKSYSVSYTSYPSIVIFSVYSLGNDIFSFDLPTKLNAVKANVKKIS